MLYVEGNCFQESGIHCAEEYAIHMYLVDNCFYAVVFTLQLSKQGRNIQVWQLSHLLQ